MMNNKLRIGVFLLAFVVLLAACSGENEDTNQEANEGEETESHDNVEEEADADDHSGMNHSSSGEVPDELEEADDPTFEVGSKAIIEADHMDGMRGAEATIDGAYSTTAYAVTYTPTNGGDPVENHKWVIHEELEQPEEVPLEPGSEVTINASHMDGMDGATAVIDSAEETTVYMVSFMPTNGGEEVSNHKWVTESELASADSE